MRHVRAAVAILSLAAAVRAEGTEQLLEILDLHERLATNETFQQQAKMLGAYMQEAQAMGHDDRVRVYRSVLAILRKIEAAPAKGTAVAPQAAGTGAPDAPPAPKPAGETPVAVLDAGAARLEWFKADSLDKLPEVPLRMSLWTRDLLSMGEETDRDLPPSPDAPSAARISFFLEAKAAGDHAFTVQHGGNDFRILVGDRQVVDLPRGGERTGRGVVHLEQGFHRIDVLLRYDASGDSSFAVGVLAPGASENRVVTRSDLLLKRPPPVTE